MWNFTSRFPRVSLFGVPFKATRKSLCGFSLWNNESLYSNHCLVYLLKQHANRDVDFLYKIMNSCTANRWFVCSFLDAPINQNQSYASSSAVTTFGRSSYCFQPGDRMSNLRTAATKVMSRFVEASCERDQIIMWNPPFNVPSTVACSFWLVATRLEHWKADLT